MLATHPASLTRRGALAAGAVVVVAGCDLDPRSSEPGGQAPTTGAPADPDADADLAIVADVRTATAEALALVVAARGDHPSLRGMLRPLLALHRSHARVLDGASPDRAGAVVPRREAAAALAQVRRSEGRLQRRLAGLAVQAASGELARLLAAMGAGVAQHLAALPEGP